MSLYPTTAATAATAAAFAVSFYDAECETIHRDAECETSNF